MVFNNYTEGLIYKRNFCILAPNPTVKNCVQSIIQRRGLRGLYTGITAHALRDVPGLAVYFLSYSILLDFNRLLGLSPFWCSFTSGAIGGALSWCVSLPIVSENLALIHSNACYIGLCKRFHRTVTEYKNHAVDLPPGENQLPE